MARTVHRRDRRQIDPARNPANTPAFPESIAIALGPTYVTVNFRLAPLTKAVTTSSAPDLIDWFILAFIDSGMGYSLQALPVTSLGCTQVAETAWDVGATADFGSASIDTTTHSCLLLVPDGQTLLQSASGGGVTGGLVGVGPVGAIIGQMIA
jgi:hypothetical protein